jgi:hypothetical protein
MEQEGWFDIASTYSDRLDVGRQLQIAAEDLWNLSARTENPEGLRRSDGLSQEAARTQFDMSWSIDQWVHDSLSQYSRKPERLWEATKQGLLIQALGLLAELQVWERQLTFMYPQAQHDLGQFNGEGLRHAKYGFELIKQIERGVAEGIVVEGARHAAECSTRCLDIKTKLLSAYPMDQSRWDAWPTGGLMRDQACDLTPVMTIG